MVPLPLFKLGSLFLRHISKYGANQIKKQAHDHARFRAFAARYGQMMHQLNMRMSVALLRDPEAERRAKEKAEAPTVKTEAQVKREEEAAREKEEKERRKKTAAATSTGTATTAASTTGTSTGSAATAASTTGTTSTGSASTTAPTAAATTTTTRHSKKRRPQTFQNIWTRKFRALPEDKAVDLFADVVGDTFILGVAVALILYEYWRAQQKPDSNKERIEELARRVDERDEALREAEAEHQRRLETLERALRSLQDPKSKKPLLPSLQEAAAAPTL
ncbi:OPA3 domain protein [Akanthomyces lecanii RCEF 1005]|uniref:OPA3 domain protein n=1 Tax=Akanthomyces lecanii RCEF 1005 TaxID=1081108 RepID=A0A162KUM6_CORDF|nr:OPA3 domain protein [Akanthomyces lecanii RCEF 1005]